MTFDDEITTLDTIINELKKGGKTVKGKPVYLNKAHYPADIRNND